MDSTKDDFTGRVESVFSGDDITMMVDLGVLDLWKKVRVRLYGVETPNAVKSSESTEAGQLRREVYDLVRNRVARIKVISRNASSWVCTVEVESPTGSVSLNDYLISKGYKMDRSKLSKSHKG